MSPDTLRATTSSVCLLSALISVSAFSNSFFINSVQMELSRVLEQEGEYSARLEGCIFDFVCIEEITEKINQSKDIRLDQPAWDSIKDGVWSRAKANIPPSRIRRNFVYDYQFSRKDGIAKEKRILIEEDGRKKHEDGAELRTANFIYKNVLLGPAGVFGKKWQSFYQYQIAEEAKLGKSITLVIDVAPKEPSSEMPFLYGKAYIDKNTYEILKLEWNEERIGNYALFEARGRKYGLRPKISVTSEFSVEKNGIRFPTKLFIEESYLDERGKKFVRSETTVIYRDFRFFTVEVEIHDNNPLLARRACSSRLEDLQCRYDPDVVGTGTPTGR